MIEFIYNIFREFPYISTDTRRITPNSIFFALHGASFDGNDYALAALQNGAAYVVVDRASLASESDRVIVVDDTLKALQQLAQHHRRALGIKIIAISGSNGKTTTKELIAASLATKYTIYATRGNLNNHIGVPLTLLSMDSTTQIGVVEMGASSCGEIELLCSIAEPNYGVLTNIGRAHLGGFGGEEGVKRGKGELFDYLVATSGVAFVPCENPVIGDMARSRGLNIIEYSYSIGDDIAHHLVGEYNRMNVATAVAVAREMGVEDSAIKSAIECYQPTNNRSQRVETERNTLIVDCYNANPSSMEASIRNFLAESFPDREGRVLILGDMFELGEWSAEEHRRIVTLALSEGVEEMVYLVGYNFAEVPCNSERVEQFTTRAELECRLRAEPINNAAILIKGSRGVGLEEILTLL